MPINLLAEERTQIHRQLCEDGDTSSNRYPRTMAMIVGYMQEGSMDFLSYR